jgi:hypothetical protein
MGKDHPVHQGDNGGRFQVSHGKPRYLCAGPVKTGPEGGHFQGSKNNPRYLLKTSSAKVKR